MKRKTLIIIPVCAGILAIFFSLAEVGRYVLRYAAFNVPDIDDYKKYPANIIARPYDSSVFVKGDTLSINTDITYSYRGNDITKNLASLLKDTETTSFIVIKDDRLVFEEYYHGFVRSSPHPLYSVTKSLVSGLVGIAVYEGFISSIDEPIENYVHELRGEPEGKVSIRQLLEMTSGYRFSHGDMPWTDDCKVTFTPNLRKITIKNLVLVDEPGVYNRYNDYNYVLLGMLLERTTGMSVSEYFEMKIWRKIGAENDAIWTLDGEKHECERLTNGLVACPIDLAKFGMLYLHDGNWEGEQVIPGEWVYDSTRYEEEYGNHGEYYLKYTWQEAVDWHTRGGYYKYGWWGYSEDGLDYSFTAEGHLGQVLHVWPKHNMIVVRTGKKWGDIDWWIDLIRVVGENIT
jgi:CubicO group peptidase (beta-lactamase class C family)